LVNMPDSKHRIDRSSLYPNSTTKCSEFRCSEFRKSNYTRQGYIDPSVYNSYRNRYKECIRMLNGLEKSLEKHLPKPKRRWTVNMKDHPPEH
jgi:hypothetical protein